MKIKKKEAQEIRSPNSEPDLNFEMMLHPRQKSKGMTQLCVSVCDPTGLPSLQTTGTHSTSHFLAGLGTFGGFRIHTSG